MKTLKKRKEEEKEEQRTGEASSTNVPHGARSRDNIPEEILGRRSTQGARYLFALVRDQFERNEMLPRKLDRTGTNAHTSTGVHREPDCTDQRLADHLPVVAKDVESFDAVDPKR